MKLHHRLALAVVLLAASVASAAEKTYYLPLQGHLTVNVPDGWTPTYTPAQGSWDQPVILIQGAGEKPTVLKLQPLPREGTAVPGKEEVQLLTFHWSSSYWNRSTDRNLKLDELTAGDVFAMYGTYQIAKPKEGERTHVTTGLVRLGAPLIRMAITYDGKDNADRAVALEIVKSARLQPASPVRMTTIDNAYEIRLDGKWKVVDEKTDAGKTVKELQATDDANGWKVVIRSEPAQPKPADAAAAGSEHNRVRAHVLQTLQAGDTKLEALKESTVAYCAVAEWTAGAEKHTISCYAADKSWITVHLTRPFYDEAKHRTTLDELLGSVVAARQQSLPSKKKLPVNKKPAAPKPAPKPNDDMDW